ncbi:hypothetical protein ACFVGY_06835 [Streptomyces sp. NPDC127106]|uniref:hypothetical protein n=1 Tax=Streptomyces sp. NPDC127106 TaxID=3345360 RepID=UPI00362CF811
MTDAVAGRGPKLPPSYPPKSPPPQRKPVEPPRPQPATKPVKRVTGPAARPTKPARVTAVRQVPFEAALRLPALLG